MSTRKKTKNETRLIVAASEHDPDMLYATKFFVPDPFIFLEQGGKRTIVIPPKLGSVVVAIPAARLPDFAEAKADRALRGCPREFSTQLRGRVGNP